MDRRDDPDAGDGPDAGGDGDRRREGDDEVDREWDSEAASDGERGSDGPEGEDRTRSRSAASVATEGEEWRLTAEDLEREDELSPGDPDIENTLFVLLGVAFALGVLAQFVVALP